ncbi:flagellar hook-length control protein FliK [Halomonas saccharevitans]|uniref:Flagellar hook-length control protein FliK n=1 Tax=Halomonas saccharevitans TaxID=416872 RepID=A0ABU3NDE7_9GAMM|nr:flagellar hook-length control protein FliK [Halomonas saccharevitans]MDT8879201.1 flagellar hook-length control protein FliK [Halomonas saccharevitans]
MDIQLLINAPGNAAGKHAAAGDAKAPGGEFARHLAGASQAHGEGAGKTAAPAPQATSSSLTPLAATHGQGEASADAAARNEALKALLAKASGATGATGETGEKGKNAGTSSLLAPLLDGKAGREAWTRLSADDIEVALQSLEQGAPRPGVGETAGEGSGVWDALQERLALIEQAGRPEADDASALLPLAAVVNQASASAPGTASLAGPATRGPGQEVRTNPLLEAIAADRRALAGPPQSNAAALSANAERPAELAAGNAQTTASADEALRFSAVSDALLAQRGESSRAPGGSELIGQGAANAMTGAMNGATGGGMAGATAGASAMAQASLTAPLASPAWSQQLGQQMVRLSQQGGEQRVELKLHPAELGPLSVSLKMGDHGAQAQFVSAHAQVRQALEQAIPQLREALAEQGISLGETSVGEQRQGGTEGDGASGQPGGMLASGGSDDAEEGTTVTLEERGSRERALDGRVDLYA